MIADFFNFSKIRKFPRVEALAEPAQANQREPVLLMVLGG